jgi:hypothetical protein
MALALTALLAVALLGVLRLEPRLGREAVRA